VPSSTVPVIGGGPARLAGQLTDAETALAEGDDPPAALARQALIVQLACLRVAAHPGWAKVVTEKVAPARRAAAAADIAATADLLALTRPRPRLPPWRIVAAEDPATLLAEYRAAQAATGVGVVLPGGDQLRGDRFRPGGRPEQRRRPGTHAVHAGDLGHLWPRQYPPPP
jgi:hypothetical protein